MQKEHHAEGVPDINSSNMKTSRKTPMRDIPDEECEMQFDSIEKVASVFHRQTSSLINMSEDIENPEPRGVPRSSPTKPNNIQ